MRPKAFTIALLIGAVLFASIATLRVRAQQIVDRIVVRIEDDILTQSDLDQLAAYQELVTGHADPDDRLTQELIEQWIVNSEAQASHFPAAPESEVADAITEIQKKFANSAAYEARVTELGLSDADVHQMVERQTFLERYLDSKFRDSVQIDEKQIEAYYKEQLVPALQKQGQLAPPLSSVDDHIRELLTEQQINKLADQWLDESKGRLRIEIVPATSDAAKAAASPANPGAPK
jgi:hypothetical protein